MAWLMARALPMTPHLLNSSSSLSSCQSETVGTSLSYSTPIPSPSLSTTCCSPIPLVYCGRGDRKTAKGKRFNHSFGNARPRNKKKGRGPPRIPVPSSPPKTDQFEDEQVVKIDIDETLA